MQNYYVSDTVISIFCETSNNVSKTVMIRHQQHVHQQQYKKKSIVGRGFSFQGKAFLPLLSLVGSHPSFLPSRNPAT